MSNPEAQTVFTKTRFAHEAAREAAMDAARCPLWVDMHLQTIRIPPEGANTFGEDFCDHGKWYRRLSPDFYLVLLGRMNTLRKQADQEGKLPLAQFNEMCRRFLPIERFARAAYSPTALAEARQRMALLPLPPFPGVKPKPKPKAATPHSKPKEYTPLYRRKRARSMSRR